MPDNSDANIEGNTPKAPKDRSCQFCGQAFTSSSLGRHLDLYIKDKNPKAPDGVHDVDVIRQLRGNITRRQPKGAGKRDTTTPIATPAAASHKSPASEAGSSHLQSPSLHKEGRSPLDYTAGLTAYTPRWEATGVISDALRNGGTPRGAASDGTHDAGRTHASSRVASKQLDKSQLDMKQKMQDALDRSRAAELALREVIASWRAAKLQIDTTSLPFDFDPLSLDFPALVLQCLKAPPTLFSSTQLPTPTSWSITPPGQQQHVALVNYFTEEFRKWKITCTSATTAIGEDFTYPPSLVAFQPDTHEYVRKALKTAESLERQVADHLDSAFNVWNSLSSDRQQELWVLELARSAGRKQNDVEKLKKVEHTLKQENANLRSQIEHLNRLQQPREYKLFAPSTVPFDREFLIRMQEAFVVNGHKAIGLDVNDRHSDLNTLVAASIDRWKNVVTKTRSAASSIGADKAADQPATAASTPLSGGGVNDTPSVMAQKASQAPVPIVQQPPPPKSKSGGSSTATRTNTQDEAVKPAHDKPQSAAPTPTAPSVDDVSDQDADAEMEDDDGFAQMNTPITKTPTLSTPQQHSGQLEVQRTRGSSRRKTANGVVKNRAVSQTKNRNTASLGSRKATLLNSGASVLEMNGAGQDSPSKAEQLAHADLEEQDEDGDPMYTDD